MGAGGGGLLVRSHHSLCLLAYRLTCDNIFLRDCVRFVIEIGIHRSEFDLGLQLPASKSSDSDLMYI